MEWNIYIDESGSINDHNKGVFEVAMLIVLKDTDKKARNFFSKKFLNYKLSNNIPLNKEIKAHFLWLNNGDNFIEEVFQKARASNKIVSSYINNREKTELNYRRTKEEEFYNMINLMLERAISLKYIKKNDVLNILCDNRNNLSNEINKLKISSFYKYDIKIKEFKFIDSQKDIMIQVADIVSAKCFRDILNELSKNIPKKIEKNISIRKIFY